MKADDKTTVRIINYGLNAGSAGATIASLLDEVPTSAAGAQKHGSTNSPNFANFDLSRVEVLRGPLVSLYGASAEGAPIDSKKQHNLHPSYY